MNSNRQRHHQLLIVISGATEEERRHTTTARRGGVSRPSRLPSRVKDRLIAARSGSQHATRIGDLESPDLDPGEASIARRSRTTRPSWTATRIPARSCGPDCPTGENR